jgi:hypothetical protein
MGSLNRKQRQAVWITLVVALLFAAVGLWWETGLAIVAGGVVIWKLAGSMGKPENAVVKSVRCAGCGSIGEPHWKTCPRCGGTDWVKE